MKKLILVIITVLVIIGIVVFINSQKKTVEASSLEYVERKGELVLGLDDSFPPMGYRDENNEIVGFDIDVARQVCKRLGVSLKLQPISWAAKQQELDSKNIDCIWNGMSIDEDRKEKMNLSDSYMENNMVFVVLKNSKVEEIKDLEGKKIGVQTGSSAQKIIEESDVYDKFKEVIGYNDNILAFMDLEVGGVDAVFVDEILANYYISSENKEYVILEEKLAKEEYAIGFRKSDQELRDKVQDILQDMKKDGNLGEISVKWFGKDITTVKVSD